MQPLVDSQAIGILGATSSAGQCLLHMLANEPIEVHAFSRRVNSSINAGIRWHSLNSATTKTTFPMQLPLWICLAPIWVLPEYFTLLEASAVRRIVVVSSTSRFTKEDSTDAYEKNVADQLSKAEQQLQQWAQAHQVEWVILRPTLIYGFGRDKNIVEIMRFIQRFGCFPLFGQALGKRQPIHVKEVAGACYSALVSPQASNQSYNISGGETLTYREMISRIFSALQRPVRIVTVPLWMFRLAVAMLRILPRYRHWSSAMAERMNHDLVFDHGAATRDFDFAPGMFTLTEQDIP